MSTILQQIRERNAEAGHQYHAEAGDIQSGKYGQSVQPDSRPGQRTKDAQSEHSAKDAQSVQPEHPTNLYGETVQPASAGDIEDRLAAVEEANKILVEAVTEMASAISHHRSALEIMSEVPQALDEYLKAFREEQSKTNLDNALKIDMLKSLVTDLQETVSEDNDEGVRDVRVEDIGEEEQGLVLGFSEIGLFLEARPGVADLEASEVFTQQLMRVLDDAADLHLITIEDVDNAAAFIMGEGEEECPTRARIMNAEPPKPVLEDLTDWWNSYESQTIFIPQDLHPGEVILGVVYGTQTAVSSDQVIGCLRMLVEEDD